MKIFIERNRPKFHFAKKITKQSVFLDRIDAINRLFNSPFGLFLSSSVILAGLTHLYQERDIAEKSAAAKIEFERIEAQKLYESRIKAEVELAVRLELLRNIEIRASDDSTQLCKFMISVFQGRPPFMPSRREYEGISFIAIVHSANPPTRPTRYLLQDSVRGAALLRPEGQALAAEQSRRHLIKISRILALAELQKCHKPDKIIQSTSEILRRIESETLLWSLPPIYGRITEGN